MVEWSRYLENVKRVLLGGMIGLVILCAFPVVARADMGPKPEIRIEITDFEDEVIYASLFAKEGGPSPVSYGDWDRVPEEIQKAFEDYSKSAYGRFVEDIWMIDGERSILDCGYIPPDSFRLVVYLPGEGTFLESGIYERYAFESEFSVKLSERTEDGKLILHDKKKNPVLNLFSLSVLSRIFLTILIELGIAWGFQLRRKKEILFIALTNLMTQLYLNIRLCTYSYKSGVGLGYTVTFLSLEFWIVVVEAILYAVFLRKIRRKQMAVETDEGNGKSSGKWTIFVMVLYAIIANVVSFLAGFVLSVVAS